MSATGTVTVTDPTGLHARPAVKLTKLAKKFESTIEIRAGDRWINAKSPNAVMKLKARQGEVLEFRADGVDEEAAIEALLTLMESEIEG